MSSILIELTDSLIASSDAIEKVTRCGNYTEVLLKGEGCFGSRLHQIWDEDRVVWRRIQLAAAIYSESPPVECDL